MRIIGTVLILATAAFAGTGLLFVLIGYPIYLWQNRRARHKLDIAPAIAAIEKRQRTVPPESKNGVIYLADYRGRNDPKRRK
jgi:hypothetical protein